MNHYNEMSDDHRLVNILSSSDDDTAVLDQESENEEQRGQSMDEDEFRETTSNGLNNATATTNYSASTNANATATATARARARANFHSGSSMSAMAMATSNAIANAPLPNAPLPNPNNDAKDPPAVDDGDSDSDIEVIEVKTVEKGPQQQQPILSSDSVQPPSQYGAMGQQQHQQQQQQQQSLQPQLSQQQLYQQQQMQHRQHVQRMQNHKVLHEMSQSRLQFGIKYDAKLVPGYIPTWQNIMPPPPPRSLQPSNHHSPANQIRAYKLSLCSQSEFILTAVHHPRNDYRFIPTLQGLRKTIKAITKHYSSGEKPMFEPQKDEPQSSSSSSSPLETAENNNNNGGGDRWRIPLSSYHPFLAFLRSDNMVAVEGIPEAQLKIASVGRAVSQREDPSVDDIIEWGVPKGLAKKLASYQRAGVDFVMQKKGRALIADDMGLGKTIQSIAAMCCYSNEWPLLVLSPSTARYHWEAEFMNWLGKDSEINCADNDSDGDVDGDSDNYSNSDDESDSESFNDSNPRTMKRKSSNKSRKGKTKRRTPNNVNPLLTRNEINVLSSSKDTIISRNTRIVVCSYGLIATLITKKKKLKPGTFKCIIVDESHMLKNRKSQRTKSLLPILQAANRVVMLSGTPALAKPIELYPQLSALDIDNGLWSNEAEFNDKYGKKGEDADANFAELHTLLKSTVMIRRMKHDVLKNLPGKSRDNVHVNLRCAHLKSEIDAYMAQLRQGRGELGKLAKQHKIAEEKKSDEFGQRSLGIIPESRNDNNPNAEKASRRAILNHLYSITGTSKAPIIIEMLQHFLNDPKNGKLCLFAHHLNVLDAIQDGAGLSNDSGSKTKFIRIDGSTNPKYRQEQITQFQSDPSVRVALLGITAAGVGVTLTAAATIWFAELFWTPAIMIQAEDRCHRIGQQSKVRCLYIIAKGTLDEVLFLLLQKKFRDLGEFVEGKEEMDIIFNHSFRDENHAIASICMSDPSDKADEESQGDSGSEEQIFNDLADEDSFRHEVEELAKEELAILKTDADEDEDGVESSSAKLGSDKVESQKERKKTKGVGSSEKHAICLSDDEDDDVPIKLDTMDEIAPRLIATMHTKIAVPPSTQMPNAELYYMYFDAPSYGFLVSMFSGRMVISENPGSTGDLLTGDFIYSVNGMAFPWRISNGITVMRNAIANPPVRLAIVRDQAFISVFKAFNDLLQKDEAKGEHSDEPLSSIVASPRASASNENRQNEKKHPDDVIQVIDD